MARERKGGEAEAAERKMVRLSIEVPEYVLDALKARALGERSTVRHVLLKAMQAAGIPIEAADVSEDRRRDRHKR